MKSLVSTLAFGFLALTLVHCADWASAEPSPDQVAAIKSNCRSDFLSKCRGVPRGGAEAMQCLKDNMASVSPGCQQALKAITAAPAKAPTPAPAVAKPEPAPQPLPEAAKPAAPVATTAPTEAPKPDSAATTPPSAPASQPAPAAEPKAAAKPPAQEALPAPTVKEPAVEKPSAPVKEAVAPPAAPEAAPVIIGRIPPRQKLMILKNCRQDLDTHCAGVEYGDGRQLSCLFGKKASLTPDCQGALAKLTR